MQFSCMHSSILPSQLSFLYCKRPPSSVPHIPKFYQDSLMKYEPSALVTVISSFLGARGLGIFFSHTLQGDSTNKMVNKKYTNKCNKKQRGDTQALTVGRSATMVIVYGTYISAKS